MRPCPHPQNFSTPLMGMGHMKMQVIGTHNAIFPLDYRSVILELPYVIFYRGRTNNPPPFATERFYLHILLAKGPHKEGIDVLFFCKVERY